MKVFDGRFFGGRKLSCHFWDGVTNYTVKEEDEKEEVGGAGGDAQSVPVLIIFCLCGWLSRRRKVSACGACAEGVVPLFPSHVAVRSV